MGWDLSKHRNIARGGSLVCIYQDPTCNNYKSLVFLLTKKLILARGGGRLDRMWGGFGRKTGLVLG